MSTSELRLKSREQGSEIHVESWGWGSIAVNIGLTLLNLAIAIPSGSLAVAAEMVHNLVDQVVIQESLQGKGPEYVFADAGVEMIHSESGTVNPALDELTI